MYEVKTEDFYDDLGKYREMFDSSFYSGEWKCHDHSNELANSKIKNDIGNSTKAKKVFVFGR